MQQRLPRQTTACEMCSRHGHDLASPQHAAKLLTLACCGARIAKTCARLGRSAAPAARGRQDSDTANARSTRYSLACRLAPHGGDTSNWTYNHWEVCSAEDGPPMAAEALGLARKRIEHAGEGVSIPVLAKHTFRLESPASPYTARNTTRARRPPCLQ